MNSAYIDCFSGVSGDMLLGALVDAGLPEIALKGVINSLDLTGCEITISKVMEQSLAATHVQVTTSGQQPHRHLQDIENIIITEVREAVRQVAQGYRSVPGPG